MLYETHAHDPLVILSLAGLMTGIALLDCWIPAHRAARSDPMIALRTE